MSARNIGRPRSRHGHAHSTQLKGKDGMVAKPNFYWERRTLMKRKRPDTLQIAGSSLPDCSHACGSCSPCRLVMVSFVCSSLEEAETCPMAYKCMCNNKSYPVP
ncbi:Protein EPIDERMAL PATTERNING FACTOR 1 [Morella rubra]|uniref:Epidermal patterning factor-like protein n=1 Tax=Morella rubra TaxID=262757 RepID=A0A6A1WZD3_9ROSI|nr:Protein EPIDERMAL PATTERNING FACTOR 1 [Morella rubra]KAB1227893.1 Protein EPIDERMAL PATTERNING FACTOR 1 [Morella rubra]